MRLNVSTPSIVVSDKEGDLSSAASPFILFFPSPHLNLVDIVDYEGRCLCSGLSASPMWLTSREQ